MMKPTFQEGDLVAILDANDEPKTYMVQRTEDLIYDYTFQTAITTGTIGQAEQVENLEPKQTNGPARIMYQIRAGVDVGTIYTELLAGSIRRTPYKQRRPTTTSPFVGYFDERTSPFHDPRFELYLRYNERPAFQVYNPWGFSITPKMSFRGKKLLMYELAKDSVPFLHVSRQRLEDLKLAVLENRIPHRRITAFGIDE
ncbi:MAG: hypothetical protein WC359_14455 [Dehalococcoidia bacterium]|jgi:hypothetical protein